MAFDSVSKPIHVECYNNTHNNKAEGRPAKYPGRCVHCGSPFSAGVKITFLRMRRKADGKPGEEIAEEPKGEAEGNGGNVGNPPANGGNADTVTNALAAILMPMVARDIDSKISAKLAEVDPSTILAEIEGAIEEKLAALSVPRELVVVKPEGEPINVGLQHRQFETLLKAVSAGCNVWLAGPSGSGKSTAAINVAKALGCKFYFTGAVGDQYALIGYNDAMGKYVRTPFREAWENGGVFLWDEVDGSDPNALIAFNAALANDVMAFPDAVVTKHADCRIIAAANTWGHGATHEYVGRMKLDQAFLKRFVCLAWDYDTDLELATAPNLAWTKRVIAVREKVKAKGLRVLVTPRESYFGAKLLASGLTQDVVESMTIKSGMTEEQWNSVR